MKFPTFYGSRNLQNRQMFDSVVSQINPAHIFTPYLFKIYFNIFLPSMSMSPKWFLSSQFRLKFSMHFSSIPNVHVPLIPSSLILWRCSLYFSHPPLNYFLLHPSRAYSTQYPVHLSAQANRSYKLINTPIWGFISLHKIQTNIHAHNLTVFSHNLKVSRCHYSVLFYMRKSVDEIFVCCFGLSSHQTSPPIFSDSLVIDINGKLIIYFAQPPCRRFIFHRRVCLKSCTKRFVWVSGGRVSTSSTEAERPNCGSSCLSSFIPGRVL